jgi:hypothetical protein
MPYGTVQADVIGTSVAGSNLGAGNASIMKNRIINGNMYVAQRATSATITAAAALNYATVDRFYGYCTGANVTMAQVAGAGNNRNLLQFTGAASVTAIGVGQRIESLNSYDMAGSIVTLSAYIANSLLTSVTWTAYYANTTDTFGSLASPTRTQIATGTFTVTSTLTQYNAQITIPSAATTGIEIVFTVGAQISGTWQLGLVQLEVGSSATGFEYRQYQQELALCQRYFYRVYDQQNTGGLTATTSVVNTRYAFPVTMRSAPTPSFITTGSWIVGNDYSANYTASTATISGYAYSTQGGRIGVGGFGGTLPAAGSFLAGSDATGTAVLGLSSEL